MPNLLIVIFLFLFGIVLAAVSVGLKVLEDQRKRRVSSVLTSIENRSGASDPAALMKEQQDDQIADLFSDLKVTENIQSALQQAGVQWTVSQLVIASVVAALAGALIGSLFPFLLFPWLTMLILAGIFGSFPWLMLLKKRRKRIKEFEEQFPEALDFLSRSMRAGHAFSISLEMLGEESPEPVGQEFRILFNELNLGAPIETAFANLVTRVPITDVRFFMSSVLLQRQTGGNMSEILMRLAYVIRERFRLRGQVKAASAHGRLTATILTILPIVTMMALMIVAPSYLPTMVRDPDGKWLIAAAIIAQILGYISMRKIVNIKV